MRSTLAQLRTNKSFSLILLTQYAHKYPSPFAPLCKTDTPTHPHIPPPYTRTHPPPPHTHTHPTAIQLQTLTDSVVTLGFVDEPRSDGRAAGVMGSNGK